MAAESKNKHGVVEMLEYVKALDIDPVREPDMLWIAEEAFSAQLPPNWGEFMDDQGRVYFYSSSTGESSWVHPMDDTFRQVVGYYRQAQKEGGFWYIEDSLAAQEEDIKSKLLDWMELFDEHGEKFFYNKKTQESTYDDPRASMYHELYCKLKMLALMREHNPILARAPRPVEETEEEKALRRRMAEQEQNMTENILKVQTMIRAVLARRRFRKMKEKREQGVARGIAPSMKGQLRLTLRKARDGKSDVVLSMTTAARRDKAALKIQCRIRGFLSRKRFRPLLLHRRHLNQKIVPIQARMRVILAKNRVRRMRGDIVSQNVLKIQRVFRGSLGRKRCALLRQEKARHEWMMECIVTLQSGFRMGLALRLSRKLLARKYGKSQMLIARICKTFLAMKRLQACVVVEHPMQCNFFLCNDILMPWRFKLQMAPVQDGVLLTKPYGTMELFNQQDIWKQYFIRAACTIQKVMRGALVRAVKRRREKVGRDPVMKAINMALAEITKRQQASVKLQARARGHLIRSCDIQTIQYRKRMEMPKRRPQLLMVQAKMKAFHAQWTCMVEFAKFHLHEAAVTIQRNWRGFLARRMVETMIEESTWPIKGFFEYISTGPEAVQVQVSFFPNRNFDDYRYFERHGTVDDLTLSIEEMEMEVALCVDQYLQDRGLLAASRERTLKRDEDEPPIGFGQGNPGMSRLEIPGSKNASGGNMSGFMCTDGSAGGRSASKNPSKSPRPAHDTSQMSNSTSISGNVKRKKPSKQPPVESYSQSPNKSKILDPASAREFGQTDAFAEEEEGAQTLLVAVDVQKDEKPILEEPPAEAVPESPAAPEPVVQEPAAAAEEPAAAAQEPAAAEEAPAVEEIPVVDESPKEEPPAEEPPPADDPAGDAPAPSSPGEEPPAESPSEKPESPGKEPAVSPGEEPAEESDTKEKGVSSALDSGMEAVSDASREPLLEDGIILGGENAKDAMISASDDDLPSDLSEGERAMLAEGVVPMGGNQVVAEVDPTRSHTNPFGSRHISKATKDIAMPAATKERIEVENLKSKEALDEQVEVYMSRTLTTDKLAKHLSQLEGIASDEDAERRAEEGEKQVEQVGAEEGGAEGGALAEGSLEEPPPKKSPTEHMTSADDLMPEVPMPGSAQDIAPPGFSASDSPSAMIEQSVELEPGSPVVPEVRVEVPRLSDADLAALMVEEEQEKGHLPPRAEPPQKKKDQLPSPRGVKTGASPKEDEMSVSPAHKKGVDLLKKRQEMVKKSPKRVSNPDFIFKEPDSKEVHNLFKSTENPFAVSVFASTDAVPQAVTEAVKEVEEEDVDTAGDDHVEDSQAPGTDHGQSTHNISISSQKTGPLPKNPFRPELTVADSVEGVIPDRKSYAGTFRQGKFYPNLVSVEDMPLAQQQQVLADLEAERAQKVAYLEERRRLYEQQKKKREANEKARLRDQLEEFRAQENAKESVKVDTLKNWLIAKEEESKRRKLKEAAVIETLKQRERDATEKLAKIDRDRAEERAKRLALGQKRKMDLDKKLANARKQCVEEAAEADDDEMHRHVHHHIHYHHVEEEDGEKLSEEARMHIEKESERNVRPAEEDESSPNDAQQHVHYHLPTGAKAGAQPVELVIPPPGVPGFDKPVNPSAVNRDLGKKTGLKNYSRNVNTAIRSYSNTARPRYMRDRQFIPMAEQYM